jgi:hypothetical protein
MSEMQTEQRSAVVFGHELQLTPLAENWTP